MVKDCGATIRPNVLAAATSSSKCSGFGYCIAWTHRRMSVTDTGSFSWPPPTGWPTWRSTSDVSNSMCSLTWVIVPLLLGRNPDTGVSLVLGAGWGVRVPAD